MRGAAVAVLVGAAFLLSGCQYLLGLGGLPVTPGTSFDPGAFPSVDPGLFGSFDPNDPGFSLPPPLATYSNGTATVTIAGTSTKLDKLSSPGTSYADFGQDVGWTDGNGLYFHFYGTTDPGYPGDGFVTIDRIRDGQHWAISDPGRCTINVTENDAKGIVGTATCTGAQWADTMATTTGSDPAVVAGEPAFDATVTFKALP
jgi:hypothetical protein